MGVHYTYTCGSCGKSCHKSHVLRCNFCEIPLCWTCKKDGLCPTHYKILNPAERKKLQSTHVFFSFIARLSYYIAFFGTIGLIALWINRNTNFRKDFVLSIVIPLAVLTFISWIGCFRAKTWEYKINAKNRVVIFGRIQFDDQFQKNSENEENEDNEDYDNFGNI